MMPPADMPQFVVRVVTTGHTIILGLILRYLLPTCSFK